MSFKSGFESRESQFNTAGGSELQVRGAALLNDRLANDVRRNGTHSSGTDDDRVLRALVRNEMCWFRYCWTVGAGSLQETENVCRHCSEFNFIT